MRDYLDLSPTPCDEPCAQLGSDDYSTRARLECRAFIDQLRREFPNAEALGCTFKIRANPHDFGTYYEVAICYSDTNDDQTAAAFEIEANLPMSWDDDARAYLAAHGYDTAPKGWGIVTV